VSTHLQVVSGPTQLSQFMLLIAMYPIRVFEPMLSVSSIGTTFAQIIENRTRSWLEATDSLEQRRTNRVVDTIYAAQCITRD
jgi:hypothetical protein